MLVNKKLILNDYIPLMTTDGAGKLSVVVFCILQWVVVVVWEKKWRKQWVQIFSKKSHDLPCYLNKRQNWNYFLIFFCRKVHWTVHWRPSHFQCLSNGKSIGTVHWTHCLAKLVTGQSPDSHWKITSIFTHENWYFPDKSLVTVRQSLARQCGGV